MTIESFHHTVAAVMGAASAVQLGLALLYRSRGDNERAYWELGFAILFALWAIG